MTEKSCAFWKRRQEEVKRFLTELFRDLSQDEIDSLIGYFNKLYEGILKMEKAL